MKSYRTETTLHIVGKAWQIQALLRQWQKNTAPLPRSPRSWFQKGSGLKTRERSLCL